MVSSCRDIYTYLKCQGCKGVPNYKYTLSTRGAPCFNNPEDRSCPICKNTKMKQCGISKIASKCGKFCAPSKKIYKSVSKSVLLSNYWLTQSTYFLPFDLYLWHYGACNKVLSVCAWKPFLCHKEIAKADVIIMMSQCHISTDDQF